MKIRQKLLLAGLLLAIVPTIIVSIVIGYSSIVNSNDLLEAEAKNKLIATRNAQKDAIETYFNSLGNDLKAMADNLMAIEAMKGFNRSFGEFATSVVDSQQNKTALLSHYSEDFANQYESKNSDTINAMDLYDQLSPEAQYYQQQYIALNTNPLGAKGALDFSRDGSSYSVFHKKYHKIFRNYLNTYGLYDIFLVEPISGNVVYSVSKELDYATSLKYGPFKDSGLGRAFEQANNGTKNTVYFEDYQSYLPSYNDQSIFVSTPIFENEVQIGVLIYKAQIDKINEIMTFASLWSDKGMGRSGETYLVGPNGLLRNDSRFFIEDKDKYMSVLSAANVGSDVINEINKKDSSIGIQKIDTTATRNVFNGQAGFDKINNYRRIEVLSAYTPVNVFDKTWALMSEINADEALGPSSKFSETILILTVVTALFLILLTVFAVLNFVEILSVPITDLGNTVRKISQGDNTVRTNIQSEDEFGKFGETLNQLLDEKDQLLDEKEVRSIEFNKENEEINNSVIGLLSALNQITDKDFSVSVPVSDDIIGTVAASLNALTEEISSVLKDVTLVSNQVIEVSLKVQQTSNQAIEAATIEREQVIQTVSSLDVASEKMNKISVEANNANKLAETTIEKTKQALTTVQDSNAGINSIRETIFGTEKRIKRLGDRSQEISGIVKLINNIAERTHILALNASMHAASAGEAGRGFAVVADEVQRLAESAKDSTEEISTLVNSIRTETIDTVNAMNNVISQVAKGTELSENAGAAMLETNEVTASLVSLVQQISQHANEQAIASDEIKRMAKNIELSTQKTEVSLDEQKKSTIDLVEYSNSLKESVDVFTLPE